MVSMFTLRVIGVLLALILTYLLCQHLCKSYPMMRKYKIVTMVVIFSLVLILIFQTISLVYPDFRENYEDLLEHITIPTKFTTAKITPTIDMSAFDQKAITPATTTVIGGAMDPTVALMMQQGYTGYTGYVPPTPTPTPTPIPMPTGYTGYTGISTPAEEEMHHTGYTGYTGIVAAEEHQGTSGSTSASGPVATPAPVTPEPTGATGPSPIPNVDMSNLDMNQILPFLMGLTSSLLTRQNVNVNVYGNGDGDGNSFGNPNVNRTRFDKCGDNKSRKYNNDYYNYPNGRVRAYDEWKRRIDKDNDYVLMDQNTVNQRYRDPRKSSCPVCPLDINYPFSNYRSGR